MDGICDHSPTAKRQSTRSIQGPNASTTTPAITTKGARITPFMGFQSNSRDNIALVKDPAWHLFFNGPGNGIAMKDGKIVFAAQYWDEKRNFHRSSLA